MSRIALLERCQNPDGGWGYFETKRSQVEPTAYALKALGPAHPAWAKGVAFIEGCQEKDGGFRPAPSVPGSTWVSALAIPILAAAKTDPKALERAGNWLLETEGADGNFAQRLFHMLGKNVVDQDPKLRGWPWRPGNNSWVEPTAHSLVALNYLTGLVSDAGLRYRREIAVKMLADRRCADQGWNYGNKRVLGETLPSYPETTGIALVGLAAAKAEAPLEAARKIYAQAKGAYARAWLAIGLRLHGVAVDYQPGEAPHPSGNLALNALEILAANAAAL